MKIFEKSVWANKIKLIVDNGNKIIGCCNHCTNKN